MSSEPKKTSKERTSFWKRGRFGTKLLAVILAIAVWLIVALTDTTTQFPRDVDGVPINTENVLEALENMGLSIIEMEPKTVTAKVRGDRSTLAGLEPSALTAVLLMNNEVNGPGTYDFSVSPGNTGAQSMGGAYQFGTYAPSTVSLKLDRMETKALPIETRLTGDTTVPDGYIRLNETLTPNRVVVTGPNIELEKIARAVVEIDLDRPLEKTLAKDYPVKLLDAQGEEVEVEDKHMTLDNSMAHVTVRVLKEDEVSLKIEFSKLPRGLDEADLPYTMSNYEVAVAGPEEAVERYDEIVLGYIDLSEVTRQNSEFIYDVKLPEDFINLENLTSVTVSFDTSNWAERVFTIPQNQIRIQNPSNRYNISIVTEAIYNVTMVGDKDAIEALTPEDLIVEMDLSEKEMSLGQYQQTVRISAPNKGAVWATGEYTVVLHVQEAVAE